MNTNEADSMPRWYVLASRTIDGLLIAVGLAALALAPVAVWQIIQ